MILHEKSAGPLNYVRMERGTDRRMEELLFLRMLRSDALAPRGRESCGWGLRV